MPFNRYEHCFAIRCLEPSDMGDDERTWFMEHFEAYMRVNYPGSDFTFTDISQEKDDEGIYFSQVIQTDEPLDKEDNASFLEWDAVLNTHLNINEDEIEIFP